MSNQNVIEARGLVKQYPSFQLGPLDFDVPKGAITALIGPNGSGKTTLLEALMGMTLPQKGSLRLFDLAMPEDEAAIKAKIGYTNPDLSYLSWGRVGAALGYFRPFYPDWDNDYCQRLLREWGLGLSDRIATLSYGSKIKLGLVVAMSHRPPALILDEPTLGLDAAAKRFLFTELLQAVRDEERTVVISSHGLSDLERYADHVAMINHGQLMVSGTTESIVERYRVWVLESTIPGATLPEGLRLLKRAGALVHVLGDEVDANLEPQLSAAGFAIRERLPLSLEEVFLELTETGKDAEALK